LALEVFTTLFSSGRTGGQRYLGLEVSTVTVNRELATLRRLLHIAVEWKLILAVPKIRMLKGERQRDFVLTPAGEAEYLSLAPQPLKDAAVLMLDTGLRVGELVRLTWSDIQLEPVGSAAFGYLRVREGKSKNAKRTVPITARVRLMREARLRECDCQSDALVFGIERGTSLDHLHAKVRPLMKKQDAADFVLHSLRHTMLTRLGATGVDSFTIKKTAGHSSVTTSEKYIHPSGETMEPAFRKLETLNMNAQKQFQPKPTRAAKSASPDVVTPDKLY
jgi:integrase